MSGTSFGVSEALQQPLADVVYNADHSSQARVAFSLDFQDEAVERGLVLDVDQPALQDALQHGGMAPAEQGRYPIIVQKDNAAVTAGSFMRTDPNFRSQTYINLYASGCDGRISKRVITHEARHARDHMENPDSLNFNGRLRKTVAAIGAAVVGGGITYLANKAGFSPVETVGGGLVFTDMSLCVSLMAEYATRKHERRARAAEHRVLSEDIFVVRQSRATSHSPTAPALRPGSSKNSSSIREGARSVGLLLDQALIPDFNQ